MVELQGDTTIKDVHQVPGSYSNPFACACKQAVDVSALIAAEWELW